MKTFLIFLTFLVIFQGCGQKNAFSRFNLQEKQELALDSLQSSKIKNADKVDGVVSVIYLNQVDPEKYKNAEVFYVFMYTKDKSIPVQFRLNGQAPSLSVKELKPKNEFTHLCAVDTKWNRYFIVTFAPQGDILKFQTINGAFRSNEMRFEKDE